MIEFSFKDVSDQQFSTILNNKRITLRFWYSTVSDRWSFDMSIDNQPVLRGKKVVQDIDLLKGLNFGIGVIFAHSPEGGAVTRNSLNNSVKVYHVTKEEINASISS